MKQYIILLLFFFLFQALLAQQIPILTPIHVSPYNLTEQEVKDWDKYDDTAISDISSTGIGVHCLAEGTEILMGDKTKKNIEAIRKDDIVSVYDFKAKEFKIQSITSIYKITHEKTYRITLSDGKQIVTTGDHPFYSPTGWKSIEPEKTKMYARYATEQIKECKINEELYVYSLGEKAIATVSRIEEVNRPMQTYTLELDNMWAFIANEFIVGQE